MKKRVLFVCVHNSARSQMAEALLKVICPESFEVHSAGTQPGHLNPLAVQVMADAGIDISKQETKSIFPFMRERPGFDYVISLCDEAAHQHCPPVRGAIELHWSFPDPAEFIGSNEERLAQAAALRDALEARIQRWVVEVGCLPASAAAR